MLFVELGALWKFTVWAFSKSPAKDATKGKNTFLCKGRMPFADTVLHSVMTCAWLLIPFDLDYEIGEFMGSIKKYLMGDFCRNANYISG